MARFKAASDVQLVQGNAAHPFHNIYGCAEGDMVYINMEAVAKLTKNMTTQRDMYLIVDMSGSMQYYYKPSGFFTRKPSDMEKMLTNIIEHIAQFDDDGVDVLFFSQRLVHWANIASAGEVPRALQTAMDKFGAFGTTNPMEAFQAVVDQMRQKKRAATVFFLTDGELDDQGKSLSKFYREVLHEEFKTRDQFYCYAIEFGDDAEGALSALDGQYQPEQGPEDLFDMESADNLHEITQVLRQVGSMSAVGSSDQVTVTVDQNHVIDMINTDLIEGGTKSATGEMNQVMSFRVRAKDAFTLTLSVQGYDDMVIRCVPQGVDVAITVQ